MAPDRFRRGRCGVGAGVINNGASGVSGALANLTPAAARKLLRDLEIIRCESSLVEFIKEAWHVVEPGTPYIHNWHVDYLAAHLEAITDGVEIDGKPYNRLLINIPPGFSKSLILNVFWPAWEWGPKGQPHHRYVCAAHSQNLAIRDSTKMRRLIMSEWYQERWGHIVRMTKDQSAKTKFENTATGFREAIAAGSITGSRGTRVLVDDPHSVEGANSDQMRATTIEWFLEAVPTRLNNPITSAIIVIMQRLHEEDVSGVILDKQLGYDHIMLPMRYDPARSRPSLLGYEDPREEEGELLFPERFPLDVVVRDERTMGPYAAAGQFQQSPEPRGGGIIKREWWQLWDADKYPAFDYVIAYLDTAYTDKQENDESAMTIWGVFSGENTTQATTLIPDRVTGKLEPKTGVPDQAGHAKIMMAYAWSGRFEFPELIEKIRETMTMFRADTLLIESKAAGYSVAQELRRTMRGHVGIRMDDLTEGGGRTPDKVSRVYSIQHLFADGLIYAPDKEWAEKVIHQTAQFPRGKHDDLVDTVSGALRYLRRTGILLRGPEFTESVNEQMSSWENDNPGPLYPGT